MTASAGAPRGIVFVEQFFFPEGWGGAQLPRELTIYLARCGYDVEVICGSDQYAPLEGPPGEDPGSAGVRIRRIPRLLRGDIHRFKLLRQLWFYTAVLPLLLFRRRPSLFMMQTNPPLVVVLGALVAAILRVPLVIIAMDLYPEVIVAHGALRRDSTAVRFLSQIFRIAYRRAARVVSLGPVMTERLIEKGVEAARITEISNWSTGTDGVVRGGENRLLDEWQLRGKFVVAYSGNLGIGHEFDTFLGGFAAACVQLADLRLVVVGKGSRLAEVRAAVTALGISDRVHFSGFLPAERMPEGIGVADLALVTLRAGFEGLVVPSKLYGYLSRAVPVLYVGPRSDVEAVVQRAACGFTARNADVEGVRTALSDAHSDRAGLAQMGAAGLAAYRTGLTAAHALDKYAALVEVTLRK